VQLVLLSHIAAKCDPVAAAAAVARLMWNKHWEHHNQCGEPHADPDFHKGEYIQVLAIP
jgi:hypothetical protein